MYRYFAHFCYRIIILGRDVPQFIFVCVTNGGYLSRFQLGTSYENARSRGFVNVRFCFLRINTQEGTCWVIV